MFPVAELRSVMPAAAQAGTRRVEPLLAILRIDEQSGKELLQRFPTRVFDGHILEANAAGEALIEIDGQAYRGQLSVPRPAGEQVIAKWVERLPTPGPATSNGDATVRLGGESKILSAFAAAAEQETSPLKLTTSIGADVGPAQLASELSRAINSSGVFYESHLRRWATGNYATRDVLREPQARLPAQLVRNEADASTATTPPMEAAPPQIRAAQTLEATFREQFRAIEHGETRFEITPWSGQTAQLTLFDPYRPGQHQHPGSGMPAPASEAALSVNLPNMGRLDLRIKIIGDAIWVNTQAFEPSSLRLLREASSALASALDAIGLRLVSSEVLQHDK